MLTPLPSLQRFQTFSTVSLHDLVKAVSKLHRSPNTVSEYTCHIAHSILKEDTIWLNSYVWSKLLEESFPGFAYIRQKNKNHLHWAEAHTCDIADADYRFMLSVKNNEAMWLEFAESSLLRERLFLKLLAQPDRTLVIPHFLASLA